MAPASSEHRYEHRSVFSVPEMDCPTEVSLIRLALVGKEGIGSLDVDLAARQITVRHAVETETVLRELAALDLGAELVSSEQVRTADSAADDAPPQSESKVLQQVLAINALMFVVEFVVGWLADSTGLLADSLDMFADASVYVASLYAVSRGVRAQYRAAKFAGALQAALAVGMVGEVARRAVMGSEPMSLAMIPMAATALLANLLCVWLLRRHRDGGAHMQASWIFTTNDALANLGVVLAGVLVLVTHSAIPDLVIGAVIAAVVLRGAIRILRIPKPSGDGQRV